MPAWAGCPAFWAAAVVAVLAYSGVLRPPAREVRSLVPPREVREVVGILSSSPVRVDGRLYRADFRAVRASDGAGLSSSAEGDVSVLLPADAVESRLPGGLWTAAGSGAGVLAEEGARLRLSVRGASGGTIRAESVRAAEGGQWGGGFSGALARLRAGCRLRFRFLMRGWGRAGALVLALLTSDRSDLDPAFVRSFRTAGLSHVLALSGMHLSLFGSLALGAGRRALGRRGAAAFRLLCVAAFVWLAGLSPSLVRALLCLLVYAAADSLRLRRPHPVSALSAAFLAQSALFPNHIHSAAFMLSYSALAGILVLSPAAARILVRVLPLPAANAIAAGLGAFVSSSPVSAALFGAVSPVAVVASPVVSPLAEWFMRVSLAAVALSLALPFLSGAFGGIMGLLYEILGRAAAFFASAQGVR